MASTLTSTDTKVVSQRLLELTDFDEHGQLLIGELLEECDVATCMSAEKLTKTACVTAQMDDLLFENVTCRPGDVLIIRSQVTRAYNASLECYITVDVESVEADICTRLCSSYFVYVAISPETGRALKVPEMKPGKSQMEQFNWLLAADRKDIRMNRARIEGNVPKEMSSMVYESRPFRARRTHDPELFQMQRLVMPPHTNHNGSTFGGVLMKWALEIATITCSRHVFGRPLTVIAIDDVYFLKPSRVGHRVILKSAVNRVFETSMEVGVRIEGVQYDGTVSLIARCYFTMCLFKPNMPQASKESSSRWEINEKQENILTFIPQVPLITDDQKRRFANALGRRKVRQERLILRGRALTSLSLPSAEIAWKLPEDRESATWIQRVKSLCHKNVYVFSSLVFDESSSVGAKDNWTKHYENKEDGIVIQARTWQGTSTLFRASFVLNAEPEACFSSVQNVSIRKQWDQAIPSMIIKLSIDEENDIAQMVHKPFPTTDIVNDSTLEKEHEYILLRSWRKIEGNQIILAQHSIAAPILIPEQPHRYLRKAVGSSGYMFQRMKPGATEVIHVLSESRLLVTSEILRYCDFLGNRLRSMKHYVEQQNRLSSSSKL